MDRRFSTDQHKPSVVEDQGLYGNSCGYCKSVAPTSLAHGLWAHSLSPYDYQELLDRTWRRSGMFLYRPELSGSCCTAYTIRLDVDSYRRSKEHMRTLKRIQRYLDGTYNDSHTNEEPEEQNSMECKDMKQISKKRKKIKHNLVATDTTANLISIEVCHAFKECIQYGQFPSDTVIPDITIVRMCESQSKKLQRRLKTNAHYTCSVAFVYAATLLKDKDACVFFTKNSGGLKNYEDVFSSTEIDSLPSKLQSSEKFKKMANLIAESIASKLQNYTTLSTMKVESCDGHLNFTTEDPSMQAAEYTVVSSMPEYAAHVSSTESFQQNKPPALSSQHSDTTTRTHKLEIRTKKSTFDTEEFALYRRYQIEVHHENPDDVTEISYRRFLVDTPLRFVPPIENRSNFYGFGSFHQQYRIDDQLVAVGVIDILPSCLSSNYFFWDPDMAFLSLGKFSALKEIELVQEMRKFCPSLQYYYLGHYIHSCPKMHYKVAFHPSELLCPVRLQWVPFNIARPILEKQPNICLSDALPGHAVINIHELDNNAEDEEIINNVLLKIGDEFARFQDLQEWSVPEDFMEVLIRRLRNYTRLVGGHLATRMAYTLG